MLIYNNIRNIFLTIIILLTITYNEPVFANQRQQGGQGGQGSQGSQYGGRQGPQSGQALIDNADNIFKLSNTICPINKGYNDNETKNVFNKVKSTLQSIDADTLNKSECNNIKVEVESFLKNLASFKSHTNSNNRPSNGPGLPPQGPSGHDQSMNGSPAGPPTQDNSLKNEKLLDMASNFESILSLLASDSKNKCSTADMSKRILSDALSFTSEIAGAVFGPQSALMINTASQISNGVLVLFKKLLDSGSDPIESFMKEKKVADMLCMYNFFSKKQFNCDDLRTDLLRNTSYNQSQIESLMGCYEQAALLPESFYRLINSYTSGIQAPSTSFSNEDILTSSKDFNEFKLKKDNLYQDIETQLEAIENPKIPKDKIKRRKFIDKNIKNLGSQKYLNELMSNMPDKRFKDYISNNLKANIEKLTPIMNINGKVKFDFKKSDKIELQFEKANSKKNKDVIAQLENMLETPLNYYGNETLKEVLNKSITHYNQSKIHFPSPQIEKKFKNSVDTIKLILDGQIKSLSTPQLKSLSNGYGLSFILSFYQPHDRINSNKSITFQEINEIEKGRSNKKSPHHALKIYNQLKVVKDSLNSLYSPKKGKTDKFLSKNAQEDLISGAFKSIHDSFIDYKAGDDIGDTLLDFVNNKVEKIRGHLSKKSSVDIINNRKNQYLELMQLCHTIKPLNYTMITQEKSENSLNSFAEDQTKPIPAHKELTSFCRQFSCRPQKDFPENMNYKQLRQISCSADAETKDKVDDFLKYFEDISENNKMRIFSTALCNSSPDTLIDKMNNLKPITDKTGYFE